MATDLSRRFAGKNVLITGGAGGLGVAAAERIAQEGGNLFLVDLKEDALAETKASLSEKYPDVAVETFAANVSRDEEVRAYVDKAVETFGSIDAFFNNAGIEGTQNDTHEYGSDEFEKVIAVNLNGVFYGMQAVLAQMVKQGYGRILNTASVGGIRGVRRQSGYAASKHGVVGLTRNSAREYGDYDITINAIAPGPIHTPLIEQAFRQLGGDNWEAVGKEWLKANPKQRLGTPEEVSAAVAFLLSDEASFINAVVLPIDGGQSAMY